MSDLDRMIIELRAAQNEISRLQKENRQLAELVAKAVAMLKELSVEDAAVGRAIRASVRQMSGKP